jgi:hypothetical protein
MCGSEAVPPFTYWLWTARLYWIVVFSYTILLIDSSGPDFLFCFLGIMLPRVHLHVPWEWLLRDESDRHCQSTVSVIGSTSATRLTP